MDFIQDNDTGPDLSTAEAATKTITEIHKRQRELVKSNRNLKEQLDTKSADLAAAMKTVNEIEQRAKMAMEQTSAESDIARYIDGDKIRWTSRKEENGEVRRGLLDDTKTVCDWQREMRSLVDTRTFARLMLRHDKTPRIDSRIAHHMKVAPVAIQRLFTDASGQGGQWVPDLMAPSVVEELTAARQVESLFPTWAMPGKEMLIPFLTLQSTPYIRSLGTSDDPSKFTASTDTSAQRSVSASSFAVRMQVDSDLDEDSAFPLIPVVRGSIVSGLVDAFEDAIVNGDTGTHQDNDLSGWNPRSRWDGTVGSSADHRRAFVGLRARCADVSSTTDQSSANTFAGFLAARSNLDSPHGLAARDLVAICSPEHYVGSILGYDEVQTLEKYGPGAVILSGEAARVGGVPIVVSEFITNDLAATGLYTGSGATTGFLMVNRNRFYVGQRSAGQTVELSRDITRGVIDVVGTMRKAYFTLDSSTKKNCHWSFNL